MRLGIDFDNTVVNYDDVFHRAAIEKKLIPPTLAATKLAVRDWLRRSGREEDWTLLQGYVYGARMNDAQAYPGVMAFMSWARRAGIPVFIISHKTLHPFLGPRYNLHEAARNWVETRLSEDGAPLVDHNDVFFETTKSEKWARIATCRVTHFIDDLPEILLADSFPEGVHRVLFDPDECHTATCADVIRVQAWDEIQRMFSG